MSTAYSPQTPQFLHSESIPLLPLHSSPTEFSPVPTAHSPTSAETPPSHPLSPLSSLTQQQSPTPIVLPSTTHSTILHRARLADSPEPSAPLTATGGGVSRTHSTREFFDRLESIRQLQADVGALHAGLEEASLKSGQGPQGESGAGGMADFDDEANKFVGRLEAVEEIMGKLADLSERLTQFHEMPTPRLHFPRKWETPSSQGHETQETPTRPIDILTRGGTLPTVDLGGPDQDLKGLGFYG